MNLTINTRLDAINYILGCIGLAPVEAEDDYNLDVAQAAQAMDNISRGIQDNRGRGWWFNREYNNKFTPDPLTFQVLVPNNTLAVYMVDNYRRHKRIATRGRALYDTRQHRYDMRSFTNSDGFVNLTLVTQLEFDDLPYSVKDAIAKEAGVRFATSNEMDINRIKILQQYAQDAYFSVESENTSQEKTNAFKDNSSMALFDSVGGGYNNWN
ncbi:MAG: hypothetical protein [Bacteriophage sp.]|nr:MAG: hypothetical protein [Bacteriophage sp.]